MIRVAANYFQGFSRGAWGFFWNCFWMIEIPALACFHQGFLLQLVSCSLLVLHLHNQLNGLMLRTALICILICILNSRKTSAFQNIHFWNYQLPLASLLPFHIRWDSSRILASIPEHPLSIVEHCEYPEMLWDAVNKDNSCNHRWLETTSISNQVNEMLFTSLECNFDWISFIWKS